MGCLSSVDDDKDQQLHRETVDYEYEAYTFRKLICLLDPTEAESVKSGFFAEFNTSANNNAGNLFGSPQQQSKELGSSHNQQESLANMVQSQTAYQSMRNMMGGRAAIEQGSPTRPETTSQVEDAVMKTLREICENCNYFTLNKVDVK